jgi:hypothetical protein
LAGRPAAPACTGTVAPASPAGETAAGCIAVDPGLDGPVLTGPTPVLLPTGAAGLP